MKNKKYKYKYSNIKKYTNIYIDFWKYKYIKNYSCPLFLLL